MGNRISIQFKLENRTSIVLFSHWDGTLLIDKAELYAKALREEVNEELYPLDRLEPSTAIIDFIRHLTLGMERVKSNYYLGKDKLDGDNSDNGHWVLDLQTLN